MYPTNQRVGDTVIVRLSGPLTEGSSHRHGALWSQVDSLARHGARRIVINLRGVPAVDALGIGEIAEAYRRARDHGVSVTLVAPGPRIERLLSITRLTTLIDVYPTEAQALDVARAPLNLGAGAAAAAACA